VSNKNFSLKVYEYNIEDDIRALTQNYKSNPTHFYMECPFCGRKDFKFYVNKKSKLFICFVCEVKGHIYKLLSHLKGITEKDAFKLVHGYAQNEITDHNENLELKIIDDLFLPKKTFFEDISLPVSATSIEDLQESHEAIEYLEYRGIDLEVAKYFDLHFDMSTNRIIFPIYYMDKMVGFQARDISGVATPKIISSHGFPKAEILYNYNQLVYNQPESVMLVEGPIDCIKSHNFNSVALIGNKISNQQINLLLKIPSIKVVYIALDPEEKKYSDILLKELSPFWETRQVTVEDGRDIGSYQPYEISSLLKTAKSVFDFKDEIRL